MQVHTFPAFHPKAPNDELHLAGLLTFLLSGLPSHSVLPEQWLSLPGKFNDSLSNAGLQLRG